MIIKTWFCISLHCFFFLVWNWYVCNICDHIIWPYVNIIICIHFFSWTRAESCRLAKKQSLLEVKIYQCLRRNGLLKESQDSGLVVCWQLCGCATWISAPHVQQNSWEPRWSPKRLILALCISAAACALTMRSVPCPLEMCFGYETLPALLAIPGHVATPLLFNIFRVCLYIIIIGDIIGGFWRMSFCFCFLLVCALVL